MFVLLFVDPGSIIRMTPRVCEIEMMIYQMSDSFDGVGIGSFFVEQEMFFVVKKNIAKDKTTPTFQMTRWLNDPLQRIITSKFSNFS